MDTQRIEKGMWVESKQGVGRVLVVDRRDNMVLVEGMHQEQWALSADDIEVQEQMHLGCDQYY